MKYLGKADPQMERLIKLEQKRQAETLMMIPSENIVSKAVEEAAGSCLGNKYAEGYPGRRYYQGQEIIDQVETLVIERAKKLFGVPAVNVQPHSGSPANFAVYTALLNPGDTLMGFSLKFGGHLTHGADLNASSRYFRSVPYETDKNGYLDYDAIEKLAKKEKPKIIIAGFTAYSRILDWKRFSQIADEVGAYLLADISHVAGLIAAGVYPSPVPYAHIVTTTTHKTLRAPRGAMIMVTDIGLKKDPDLAKKIDKAIIPGIQGGPHMNTIAAIGVALKEDSTKKFVKYAKQIIANAKVLSEELKKYGFYLSTGGTDSHLILIDLRNKNLLGNTVAEAYEKAGIVTNRNSVPFDPNPPFYPSGLRLGTPGLTSRGMKEREMKKIAVWMNQIVEELMKIKEKKKYTMDEEKKKEVRKEIISQSKIIPNIKKEVLALCKKFHLKTSY
ncbi:MAG: serine hydroxymethyltransferase [Candidatus Roizmanbacteria bacterium]|nr:MAG: serine hydroxymethyltransferase [Candidatus Roizmanbacteria bacterium]